MSDDKVKPKGIFVIGTCNGQDSYPDKNGVVRHSLLVIVPNSNGVIQISLPNEPASNAYPIGSDLQLTCKPRFFNGRMSGLELIK
ncbi:MAG: hypothetical protein OCC45_06320 [Desulfotalea sp.]